LEGLDAVILLGERLRLLRGAIPNAYLELRAREIAGHRGTHHTSTDYGDHCHRGPLFPLRAAGYPWMCARSPRPRLSALPTRHRRAPQRADSAAHLRGALQDEDERG